MKLSDASAEIRIAVLGDWVPSQLADVLAQQRAEEPETTTTLVAWNDPTPAGEFSLDDCDLAISPSSCEWLDWVCEPLWHDTLAVAVAKRSHLLVHPEVSHDEVLKQTLIRPQSLCDDPWRTATEQVLGSALEQREEIVGTFDVVMTLVSAGYGIAIAPAARLAGYRHRGIAVRPLTGRPSIVMTYLLRPRSLLPGPLTRIIQRAHSMTRGMPRDSRTHE